MMGSSWKEESDDYHEPIGSKDEFTPNLEEIKSRKCKGFRRGIEGRVIERFKD